MTIALCQRMNLAEFLAWEKRQDLNYEFDGDAVLAMPEIGIELPLTELYEGLDLSQPAGEANA